MQSVTNDAQTNLKLKRIRSFINDQEFTTWKISTNHEWPKTSDNEKETIERKNEVHEHTEWMKQKAILQTSSLKRWMHQMIRWDKT